MSLKHHKKLSLKRKKTPEDNSKVDIFHKLGLEACLTKPLDTASVLDISTWIVENPTPRELKELPNAFLRRLWLLNEDARSTCCQPKRDNCEGDREIPEDNINDFEKSQSPINPLDLVASVFMSANCFLQQEMTVRMNKSKFAIPLILPSMDSEKSSQFLVWPSRGVLGQWRSHSLSKVRGVLEGNLASTRMPIVSCVRLGHCSLSKSHALNYVLNGPESHKETFLHRRMDGGHLPRRLSNGLVEIGWYLPTGDQTKDPYPVPFIISNLRGDASTHETCLRLLCEASSAVIVFCGDLREQKENEFLKYFKDMTCKIILVDALDPQRKEENIMEFIVQSLKANNDLPEGCVLPGNLGEQEIANSIGKMLKSWLPENLKLFSLEESSKLASELGFAVDEGPTCKKAMERVEDVLKDFNEGSAQFRQKQLPLQGPLWIKLSEITREESKQRKEGRENDPRLQNEMKDIMTELKSYQLTASMKGFIDALSTKDKTERAYFLSWLKVRLFLGQKNCSWNSISGLKKRKSNKEHNENRTIEDSFIRESMGKKSPSSPKNTEQQTSDQYCNTEPSQMLHSPENDGVSQPPGIEHFEPDPASFTKQQMGWDGSVDKQVALETNQLGIEHFLREIGIIFELTHSNGSQNVLRLPSLAADLLLYGVPLELMDGDALNIPLHFLGCVFTELKHVMRKDKLRTRVLTNLGHHCARNAEVLSALFGVNFPEGQKGANKGMYMAALCPPHQLETECDVLLFIDVEGLGLVLDEEADICDNIMATVATGLSDVLIQNISPHDDDGLQKTISAMVNALLCSKECGEFPICHILTQDKGVRNAVQASQLMRVSRILQSDDCPASTTCLKGPWSYLSLSEPVPTEYSKALLKLKKNLFGSLKRCAGRSDATDLPHFMDRLCVLWERAKSDSFCFSLQNNDIAQAFSLLCREFSQWEDGLRENIENWTAETSRKIFETKAIELNDTFQKDLTELQKEAQEEVKAEMKKIRLKVESHVIKNKILNTKAKCIEQLLAGHMTTLERQVTKEITQKLDTIIESHCSFTQLKKFENMLSKEKELKILALVETNKSTKTLLHDHELEEEFESIWRKTLADFAFRPSETEDISPRVKEVLRQNLTERGLQKHLKKIDVIGQQQSTSFQVCDEHFGYRSRLKHMFEDNNKQQKIKAQQSASRITEEYNQFVANKLILLANFSENVIKELLANVEKSLEESSMEIRSAFEVDLKIYLCNAACKDFQKLHDRYDKDTKLVTHISETKKNYLAEFIYQFRKRDQCPRLATTFVSLVVKPTALDFIHRTVGLQVVEEIRCKDKRYHSSGSFHQRLLEELIEKDHFESFVEYLSSYNDFRLKKIQETVAARLSESTSLQNLRYKCLGEIVGKFATAVSKTTEGTRTGYSEAKPLLERFCQLLERDEGIEVNKVPLKGPVFNVTTDWDQFLKVLLELLATMRLDIAQEFSKHTELSELLNCFPSQPQDHLLKIVEGCDIKCPLCKAPCEEQEIGHETHKARLHRPKGLFYHNSNSEDTEDAQGGAVICNKIHSPHSDWSESSDEANNQKTDKYWRYVLTRFNERFAAEFKQKPANIPEEWRGITKDDAIESLREVFGKESD